MDQPHPNRPATLDARPDESSLTGPMPGDGALRPFAGEPGRWEAERHRALHERAGRVDEPTGFGWIRWNVSHDEAVPDSPLQIAVVSPELSRTARLARRWLTRRPPRLRLFGGDLLTPAAALLSLVAGLYVMARHLLPMDVVLPATLLIPLFVSTLPRRLDAAAHRVVRVIEAAPASGYLQCLAALHVRVAHATAANQIPSLAQTQGQALHLGHRVMWDAIGRLTERGTWPCCNERLLTDARLYTELAQQTLEAAAARSKESEKLRHTPEEGGLVADQNGTPSQEIAAFGPVEPLITVMLKDEAQEVSSKAEDLRNQRIAELRRLMEQPRRPYPMARTDLRITQSCARFSPQNDDGPWEQRI
ncbi:hypothetical protein ACWGQ9_20790 [Streptomyces parvus]